MGISKIPVALSLYHIHWKKDRLNGKCRHCKDICSHKEMRFFIFPLGIYKVEGHSMEPYLKQGDRVIVNKCSYLFSSPKIGDIIIFKSKNRKDSKDKQDNKTYIKRIIAINNNKFSVAGDNKKDSKKLEPISRDEIIGKVIMKY
jgi:signal peptidase I